MIFLEALKEKGLFSGIDGKYHVKTTQTLHAYFLKHCTYDHRSSNMDGTVREVATILFNALYANCHPPTSSSEMEIEME